MPWLLLLFLRYTRTSVRGLNVAMNPGFSPRDMPFNCRPITIPNPPHTTPINLTNHHPELPPPLPGRQKAHTQVQTYPLIYPYFTYFMGEGGIPQLQLTATQTPLGIESGW